MKSPFRDLFLKSNNLGYSGISIYCAEADLQALGDVGVPDDLEREVGVGVAEPLREILFESPLARYVLRTTRL